MAVTTNEFVNKGQPYSVRMRNAKGRKYPNWDKKNEKEGRRE